MKVKQFIAVALAVFAGVSGYSQTSTTGQTTNAVLTAVPFLTIGPDSRHGALGDCGVALEEDAFAPHWNLSTLAFTKHRGGVSLNYTPWLRTLVPDINLAYLTGYYNLGETKGAIGGSLRYFSLGQIEFTDENAVKTGTFDANEFAFDLGYTRKVTENLSAGVTVRYINSNLTGARSVGGFTSKPAQSVAGDLSLYYNKSFDLASGQPLTVAWGVNISNLGAKVSYTNSNNRDFLPTNARVGYMLKYQFDDYNSIALVNDFNKLLVPTPQIDTAGRIVVDRSKTVIDGVFSSFGDAPGGFKEEMQEIYYSVGLEYWYNNLFALRGGFFHEAPNKGNRQYITLGLGLRYNVFGLDFSYLASLKQNNPLQNTLRFSLLFNFGEE